MIPKDFLGNYIDKFRRWDESLNYLEESSKSILGQIKITPCGDWRLYNGVYKVFQAIQELRLDIEIANVRAKELKEKA